MPERKPLLSSARLGWVVIILAVVFIAQGVYMQWEDNKTAECNYRVAEEFRQQIIRNRQASVQARQTLIDTVEALRESKSQTEVNAAMDAYLEVARKQQETAQRQQDRELERC